MQAWRGRGAALGPQGRKEAAGGCRGLQGAAGGCRGLQGRLDKGRDEPALQQPRPRRRGGAVEQAEQRVVGGAEHVEVTQGRRTQLEPRSPLRNGPVLARLAEQRQQAALAQRQARCPHAPLQPSRQAKQPRHRLRCERRHARCRVGGVGVGSASAAQRARRA